MSLAFEIALKLSLVVCLATILRSLAAHWSADTRAKLTIGCFVSGYLLVVSIVASPEWQLTPTILESPSFTADQSNTSADLVTTLATLSTVETASTFQLDQSWLPPWLLGLYCVATGLFLLRTIIQLRLCYRMTNGLDQNADMFNLEVSSIRQSLGLTIPINLRFQSDSPSPFVWGVWKPVIALPRDFSQWSSAQRRNSLTHELAHVQRGDCFALMFMQLTTALVWWHPLAWLSLHRFREDIERAADDVVLNNGASPTEYAAHLIEITRRLRMGEGSRRVDSTAALQMATGLEMKNRIKALIKPIHRRNVMTRFPRSALYLTLAVFSGSLGGLSIAAIEPQYRQYLPVVKVTPVYPEIARAEKIEGYVVVEFDVSQTGRPENVSVHEQHPTSGIFAEAALEAARKFYYLPQRKNGQNIRVTAIRNKISFKLPNDQASPLNSKQLPLGFSELGKYSKSNKQANQTFLSELEAKIDYAEQGADGGRFLTLASYAIEYNPSLAEYFFLRASQLGTTDQARLKTVGGMVMFHQGALLESQTLFTQVPKGDSESYVVAQQWLTFLDRETKRRNIVRGYLMDLHP
ncbi:MAG: M56 family metallopeptidase [Gammaproteobacteria bacterium]|nr:M56 family metallopeptidase [Gammaproteobacteria bacterium]